MMSPKQAQEEVTLLTPENIRFMPIDEGKIDDFRSMWNKFGPDAARTVMIPDIFYGKCPLPSEVLDGKER
jgi:hypothetical protein